MKTIAAAAVLMMLSAPAWADEAEKQTNDPANANEPVVLSDAEMDGVTAGTTGTVKWFNEAKGFGFIQPSDGDSAAKYDLTPEEYRSIWTLPN